MSLALLPLLSRFRVGAGLTLSLFCLLPPWGEGRDSFVSPGSYLLSYLIEFNQGDLCLSAHIAPVPVQKKGGRGGTCCCLAAHDGYHCMVATTLFLTFRYFGDSDRKCSGLPQIATACQTLSPWSLCAALSVIACMIH